MRVLLIPRKDVEGIVSMKEVVEVVEEAFKAKGLGEVVMPPKVYVNFPKGDFRVMPCYIPSLGFGGVKIVNVHPENPEKYGLPTVMAVILLLDPETGKPVAIMDGTWMTDMRTGAAGGVAAKYLARPDSRTVGIVGAGRQARTQLMALKEVLEEIEEVRVTDIRKDVREKYAEEMSEKLGLNVKAVDSVRETVEGADIVVTVTPVRKPIVKNEWIRPGVHINAIGADAPGKEELDPEILKRAKIVVDDFEQACHSGEVNVPLTKGIISKEDIYAELGEIIVGKKPGRLSDDEITIFDSTGLAIQDLATATLVYKKAKASNLGFEVELL